MHDRRFGSDTFNRDALDFVQVARQPRPSISGLKRAARALSVWRTRAAERRAWRKTVDAMVMADLGPPLHAFIRDMLKPR